MSDMDTLRTGLARHQAGDLDGAAVIYTQLIEKQNNNYYALHFLGVVRAAQEKFEEAARLMSASMGIEPWNVEFAENYASALMKLEKYPEVLTVCARILSANPKSVAGLYISANALAKSNRSEEAIDRFKRLLLVSPRYSDALNDLAIILVGLGRNKEALQYLDQLLEFDPANDGALLNKANVLAKTQKFNEALELYNSIVSRTRLPNAYLGIGHVFFNLRRSHEAIKAYDQALKIKNDLVDACGNTLLGPSHFERALGAYDQALAINPDLAEAWQGRGNVFRSLNQHESSFSAYDRALALRSDLEYLPGDRLYAKMLVHNWKNFEKDCSDIIAGVKDSQPVVSPFVLLSLPSSSADQLQCARTYLATGGISSDDSFHRSKTYRHDRVRLGYLSADFHAHAVSYLMTGAWERHDKSIFETVAISLGPDDHSAMRSRVENSFERFQDVSGSSDQEIIGAIQNAEIDVLIDLNGFTEGNRPNILAARPAPIQVNYLGYPGTMGADFIDYIVADKIIIPSSEQIFYREKIVYLPNSYQATDAKQDDASKSTPTREEAGLPEAGFVFCCFNNTYKLTPNVFDVWMNLLRQVEGSILWLFAGGDDNLKREAEQRGISPDRLIFAPRVQRSEHLARHRLADLFLDTLPYNAHTTASDALWMGLPVLTCPGTTFAGRVAASLLSAVGMPELITHSLEEYEALALKIARDPSLLTLLKNKLSENKKTCPLFDTAGFTRHLEAAYIQMWQRHQNGEPPESFSVSATG